MLSNIRWVNQDGKVPVHDSYGLNTCQSWRSIFQIIDNGRFVGIAVKGAGDHTCQSGFFYILKRQRRIHLSLLLPDDIHIVGVDNNIALIVEKTRHPETFHGSYPFDIFEDFV